MPATIVDAWWYPCGYDDISDDDIGYDDITDDDIIDDDISYDNITDHDIVNCDVHDDNIHDDINQYDLQSHTSPALYVLTGPVSSADPNST